MRAWVYILIWLQKGMKYAPAQPWPKYRIEYKTNHIVSDSVHWVWHGERSACSKRERERTRRKKWKQKKNKWKTEKWQGKCRAHLPRYIIIIHALCTACQRTVLKTNVRSRVWVGKKLDIPYIYADRIILENRMQIWYLCLCLLYALIDWLFYEPKESCHNDELEFGYL